VPHTLQMCPPNQATILMMVMLVLQGLDAGEQVETNFFVLRSSDECTEQTPRLTLIGLIAMIAGLMREHFGESVVQIPHGAFSVMLE